MHRLGFFRDLSHGSPNEVALASVIGQLDERVAQNVAAFLRKGTVVTPTLGERCYDVLSEAREDIGPLEILSDGEWAWPSDTAYFVEKYRVLVADAFIEHAERCGWAPHQLVDNETENAALELQTEY